MSCFLTPSLSAAQLRIKQKIIAFQNTLAIAIRPRPVVSWRASITGANRLTGVARLQHGAGGQSAVVQVRDIVLQVRGLAGVVLLVGGHGQCESVDAVRLDAIASTYISPSEAFFPRRARGNKQGTRSISDRLARDQLAAMRREAEKR